MTKSDIRQIIKEELLLERHRKDLEYKKVVVKNKISKIVAVIKRKTDPMYKLAKKINDLQVQSEKLEKQYKDMKEYDLKQRIENDIFDQEDATYTRVIELCDQYIITAKKASVYQNNISAEDYEKIIAELIPKIAQNTDAAIEMYKTIRAAYEKAPEIGKSAIVVKKIGEGLMSTTWQRFKNFIVTRVQKLFVAFDETSQQIDSLISSL